MRIIQISDSHLSMDHPSRADELETCIQHINQLDPLPDVVVHTGDVAHDGLPEQYAIAKACLDGLIVPYFVIGGNRDNRASLIDAFGDSEYLRRGMQFTQFCVDRFPVRLVFIDTVSVSSNKGEICLERLGHADQMLSATPGRPTVLFMHHPPFAATVAPDPYQFENWSDATALQDLIGRHRQIRGVYCGHVHREAKSSIGDVIAQVATCIASDLRWDNVTSCIYIYDISPDLD